MTEPPLYIGFIFSISSKLSQQVAPTIINVVSSLTPADKISIYNHCDLSSVDVANSVLASIKREKTKLSDAVGHMLKSFSGEYARKAIFLFWDGKAVYSGENNSYWSRICEEADCFLFLCDMSSIAKNYVSSSHFTYKHLQPEQLELFLKEVIDGEENIPAQDS